MATGSKDIELKCPIPSKPQSVTIDINDKSGSESNKVLHFIDGETLSYDEIGNDPVAKGVTEHNAYSTTDHDSKLREPIPTAEEYEESWGPWLWSTWKAGGNKVLSTLESTGQTLVNFFGITSPKYGMEIREYYRNQEEAKRKKEDMDSWASSPLFDPETPIQADIVTAVKHDQNF